MLKIVEEGGVIRGHEPSTLIVRVTGLSSGNFAAFAPSVSVEERQRILTAPGLILFQRWGLVFRALGLRFRVGWRV